MAVESSRWRAPVFREFYSEKDVVKEERRMRIDNTRFGSFSEAFAVRRLCHRSPHTDFEISSADNTNICKCSSRI
jgi:predicted Zn-dependent peptidase